MKQAISQCSDTFIGLLRFRLDSKQIGLFLWHESSMSLLMIVSKYLEFLLINLNCFEKSSSYFSRLRSLLVSYLEM